MCFQLTHFPRDDWKNIYILCLIVIIESEVWTITYCLGLGHETMVCAVCLSVFLRCNLQSFLLEWIECSRSCHKHIPKCRLSGDERHTGDKDLISSVVYSQWILTKRCLRACYQLGPIAFYDINMCPRQWRHCITGANSPPMIVLPSKLSVDVSPQQTVKWTAFTLLKTVLLIFMEMTHCHSSRDAMAWVAQCESNGVIIAITFLLRHSRCLSWKCAKFSRYCGLEIITLS